MPVETPIPENLIKHVETQEKTEPVTKPTPLEIYDMKLKTVHFKMEAVNAGIQIAELEEDNQKKQSLCHN